MLYRDIIAVCSEIHTKHINTLCGQKVELLDVKLVVHLVTAGLSKLRTLTESLKAPVSRTSEHLTPSLRTRQES